MCKNNNDKDRNQKPAKPAVIRKDSIPPSDKGWSKRIGDSVTGNFSRKEKVNEGRLVPKPPKKK